VDYTVAKAKLAIGSALFTDLRAARPVNVPAAVLRGIEKLIHKFSTSLTYDVKSLLRKNFFRAQVQ
jgi:hypothetical protein